MTRDSPMTGEYRLVVPMFRTGIGNHAGYKVMGRISIGERVMLASLDAEEEWRVQLATGDSDPAEHRLEIYGFDAVPKNSLEIVMHHFRLLSLVVRMAPRYHGIVVDRFDGMHWIRFEHIWPGRESVGSIDMYSYLPYSRLVGEWAALIDAWPVEANKQNVGIYRSLDAHYDSVTERRGRSSTKALLTSAVAFELLLGPGLRDELRYRMSTRGALLVAQGQQARAVSRWLGKYYDARSKLVHAGQEPSELMVDQIHQYMMRALPSMFRLADMATGHKEGVELLDSAVFGRSFHLDQIMGPGWWNFVDSEWLSKQLI